MKDLYTLPDNQRLFPELAEAARERFIAQLQRKGRASISVEVEVRDADGAVTCGGSYDWCVQTL